MFCSGFTYENVKRSSGVALAGVRLAEVEPEIQVFFLCIELKEQNGNFDYFPLILIDPHPLTGFKSVLIFLYV